jgi:hypothetical protein
MLVVSSKPDTTRCTADEKDLNPAQKFWRHSIVESFTTLGAGGSLVPSSGGFDVVYTGLY